MKAHKQVTPNFTDEPAIGSEDAGESQSIATIEGVA
jgi:hypothetical protein